MADRRLPRWARWTALGCGVAVIGASTYLVVDALPSQAATAGLRTATAATGSVTQATSLSGSVERVDQVTAVFRTGGTVTSVEVSVGDEVEAGDVLATIDTAEPKRAVSVAQAELVSAQAALDAVGSSTSPTSASSTATGSSTTAGGSVPTPSTGQSGSSGLSGPGGSGTSTPGPGMDTSPVRRAVGDSDARAQAAVVTCQPVMDAGSTPEPTPTPSPTPSSTPTPTPSPSESSTPVTSPSSSPSPSTEPSARGDTPTPDAAPSASSSASRVAVMPASPTTDGPTAEQVSACVQALSAALTAAQHTATTIDQLAKALEAAAAALQQQQSDADSTGSGSRPTDTDATTGGPGAARQGTGQGQSAATLEVSVLQATQELAAAEQDLGGAVLEAPIGGTVGQVDLVEGEPADTSSGVVVVGPGAAVVTVDLPLAQLGKVRVSQDVTVTPAGTADEVPGLVHSIGVLPSSTSSSSPTYPVRVTVSDAPLTLASGSTATATITLATADDVVTVPVSAVSGVSSGRGTVQVLAGGIVKATAVTVGAVGGGKVHVEQGLTAGQVVVVADPTTALPSSDDTSRFRRSTSGVGGLTGQGGPGGFAPPPG